MEQNEEMHGNINLEEPNQIWLFDFNLLVHRDGQIFKGNGRKVATSPDKLGYHRIWYTAHNGRRKSTSVHRLVALAFLPNPKSKPSVNHIDGNKNNNHASNLEWCDHKENINHAIDNGLLHRSKRGTWTKEIKDER